MRKSIVSIFLILVTIFSVSFTTFAAPSNSYTHVDTIDESTKLRLSREMYYATQKINSTTLGLSEALSGLTDIYTNSNGVLYILCGEESRVIRVSDDLSNAVEIKVVNDNNEPVSFKGAKGIYFNDNQIFIADTANARILICNEEGLLLKELLLPDSKLISEDFVYQPTSILRDENGYTYILSMGCYYGALLYSPTNEFLGFYGANSVDANALDTLSFLWDKLTSTEKKRAASVKKLPYSFVDFCFDNRGYMITCTGNTSDKDNGKGQLKKISPNGTDILYKRNPKGGSSVSSTINFLEQELVIKEERTGKQLTQNIISVNCSSDNFIFALDKTHGYVYLYDSECNLMSTFGGGFGTGEQLGVFQSPVSMCLKGNSLLVADDSDCSITIFEPTEYGNKFRQAQNLYLKGNYTDAEPIWEEVLKKDASNQLAHRGLAMVYYNNGDYKSAMESAKISFDYTVYDLAYSAVISKWFANNFIWILLLLIIVVFAVVYLIVSIKKGKIKFKLNEKVKIMLESPFHPFRSFEEVKYKKKGSLKLAFLVTVILYIAFSLKETCSGFLYSQNDSSTYNTWFTLIGTSGLLILWSVCNWLISSMFSGKGNFSEVYTASSYVMLPLISYTLLYALLSNVLPLSMLGVASGIGTAITIYTCFLMCIAMITIHELDFFKFLLTVIVTFFFMILVIFVILMCSILIMQFITFFKTIFEEIIFR